MKNCSSRYSKYAIGLFVFILTLSLIHWIGNSGFLRPGVGEAKVTQGSAVFGEEPVVFERANPAIQAVMAVQNRHTDVLMAESGIVGTATGLSKDGRPAILVFAKNAVEPGVIPRSLEGTPVVVKVTGEIVAMPRKPKPDKPTRDRVDPTARFERPVPIGVSTGNEGECSAGTIGARVKDDSGNVYALSNNHVYALENNAATDSNVHQPGLYDTNCVSSSENFIGTLCDFVSIDFNGQDNTIDAAIALSWTSKLGNSTPPDGYGTPKSTTVEAAINQRVKKYGRTTSQTIGKVTGINATIAVSYDSGIARFVNQIIIAPASFSAGGDSGSLVVVQKGEDARKPIGLLFAGSQLITVANPIGDVLSTFDVTIDGSESGD